MNNIIILKTLNIFLKKYHFKTLKPRIDFNPAHNKGLISWSDFYYPDLTLSIYLLYATTLPVSESTASCEAVLGC